jgi:acetylornithine/N-succinyldiaminopimelate aminotransferase
VRTGIGRSGRFLSYEYYGVQPDVVTLAKGLAGGLPMGAILFGAKAEQVLGLGDHGSTFGMNPIAAAGACVVVNRIDDTMLGAVCKKSAYLVKKLEAMPQVKSVSGRGLMLGIELEGKTAREVAEGCIERGLIILTAKHKVRLLPPLTISYEEIDKGLAILQAVLEDEDR